VVTHKVKYDSREEISAPASLGSCPSLHVTWEIHSSRADTAELATFAELKRIALNRYHSWHSPSLVPTSSPHWVGYGSCCGRRLSQHTTAGSPKSSPPPPPPPNQKASALLLHGRWSS